MYHDSFGLGEAVSLGDLHHPQSPDEPIVIRMDRHPCAPGKPRKDQHRIGRADLLSTSFETFERNIRDQLARTLGGGGFDPAPRHRRHHREPLAARLRLHLQQPDRSAGVGVHVEPRAAVRQGAPAIRRRSPSPTPMPPPARTPTPRSSRRPGGGRGAGAARLSVCRQEHQDRRLTGRAAAVGRVGSPALRDIAFAVVGRNHSAGIR